MKNVVKNLLLFTFILSLCACVASAPMTIMGASHQLLKYQQNIRLKAAAALKEEPDLLTYSVNGISENRSSEVIDTYLTGYGNNNYSQEIKSIALYQVAIIYMNRLNEQRNDEKAKLYFHRHLIEFPHSILQDRVQQRLNVIEARKQQTVQLTPTQILSQLDSQTLLRKPIVTFDEELIPLSQRFIEENRFKDAKGIYNAVYENPGSSEAIKAKSLYQLGLIYMTAQNQDANINKSSYYFRKIIAEFPNSNIAKKAQKRMTQLLNKTNRFPLPEISKSQN